MKAEKNEGQGKSGSGKYLAHNTNCKSAKTPELSRLLSKLSSELGLLCTWIKLLCLTCFQVPRSSWPHKTPLRIWHPARPYKPITPLFLSGLLRFCQGVFLSYFSKSSKVSLVCSMGFLLKPKVGKSYKHKNQQFICRIARHAYLEIELGNNLSTIHTAIIKCLETMSTRKAQDLYKQSSRVILKEVMENANKMEKCEKNKSINFSQIIIEFGIWYCMGYELYECTILKYHNTLQIFYHVKQLTPFSNW